jgi:PKD repeat protein
MPTSRSKVGRAWIAIASVAIVALLVLSALTLISSPAASHANSPAVAVHENPGMAGGGIVHAAPGESLVSAAIASLNSSNWTNISTSGGPSPRYGASMAYDPKDAYVVLFGGASKSGEVGLLNDTWTFKGGGVWTNITPTAGPAPGPRVWASLSWDAADGYLFLTGGGYCSSSTSNSSCSSAWSFEGGHWHEVDTLVPYDDSFGGSSVFDSSAGYVLTVPWWGSDSWSFLNGSWKLLRYNNNSSQLEPNLAQFTLVNYPPGDGVLLYGGRLPPNVETSTDQTWLFSKGNWTDLTKNLTSLPPPLTDAAGAFDEATQSAVLFGGYASVDQNQTWLFNGTWNQAFPSDSPPACDSGSMAWDGTDNVSILFGGQCYTTGPNSILNATWEWGSQPIMAGLSISAAPEPADVGSAVAFTASFFGGIGPFSYSWNFGDGGVSKLTAPLHTFTAPGTFTVGLILTDSANDSLGASFNLTVDPALTSGIQTRPNPTDVGLATSFVLSTVGGTDQINYSWLFGDGMRSSSQNPVHTYTSAGTFQVTVWANDTGGGSSISRLTEIVHPGLAAPLLAASPASPRLGQPVNFTTAESGGTPPYTYSWAFGDGGTGGNLSNITHIYTTNGPFEVSSIVTDAAGQVVVSQLNVSIQLQADAGLTYASQSLPFTVSFVGQAEGGAPPYSYSWAFGDGTSNSSIQDPVHTYAKSGAFVATLVVTDSKGTRTSSSLTVHLGQPSISSSGSGGTNWLAAFLIALAVGAAVAIAWAADRQRRQARRSEGTQWVEELMETTSGESKPPTR